MALAAAASAAWRGMWRNRYQRISANGRQRRWRRRQRTGSGMAKRRRRLGVNSIAWRNWKASKGGVAMAYAAAKSGEENHVALAKKCENGQALQRAA